MAENDEKEELREKVEAIVEKAKKKGLEAKVLEHYAYKNIIAFSGLEYVKDQWRSVPAGYEAEAMVHPHLAVREVGSEKEITASTKQTLIEMSAKSSSVLFPPQPESEQPPAEMTDEKVANREVEPVGDTSNPIVMEAKLEAAQEEEEDEAPKKKAKKK